MVNNYSNKQIEVSNLLHGVGKDGGISQDVIDEIVEMVSEESKILALADSSEAKLASESQIRMKILNEPEWRKRASLAAMLISKSLE